MARWLLALVVGLSLLGCTRAARETTIAIPLDSVCTVTATGMSCVPPGSPPIPPDPPATGTGTWTLVSKATGRPNWYYNVGTSCPNGELWMAWNGITSRLGKGATAWTTDTLSGPSMGWRENFSATCSDDNVVQLSPGTSGPPEWSGFVTYNMATRAYTQVAGGGCTAHAFLGLDGSRQRLVTFGGWSVNCPIKARPLTSSTWTDLKPSGPTPPLTQEGSRETSRVAGVLRSTGDAWVLADDREFWVYSASANTWSHVPTTGTKPPPYVIAAYHEAAKVIVAVDGCRGLNDGDCGTAVRDTYLLDVPTKVWRKGPSGTDAVETLPMAKRHALYDPVGQRVVVLTASYQDVQGVLGTNVWAWVPSGGTPPPVATYPLGLASSGSGSGQLTGAGAYPQGQLVAISAAPAAGSEFKSWSGPAPCPNTPAAQATVTMPAGALTCTAAFATGTPPPTSSCQARARQWVECPTPGDDSPFPAVTAGSKDVNVAWDPVQQKLVMGAGDIRSSGVADLWALNLPQGTWTAVQKGCRPAGEVMMNHPSDRGPQIVDKRGELWNWNGVPYPSQEGQLCGGTGAVQKAGLLKRATSGVWTQATATKTASLGGGAYDSTADAMLHFEPSAPCSGNPGTLVKTQLPSLAQSSSPLCIGVTWTGSTGGWVAPEQPERVFFGWDDTARKLYVVAPRPRYDAPGNVVERVASLSVWDAQTGQWAQKRSAPTGNQSLVSYHTAVVWDSVSKRLLYPLIDNPCGEVRTLYAYDPAVDQWESFPVPADVHGSTVAYDPKANALVVGGSVFCSNYGQRAIYLWRYADAPGRR